MKKNDVFTFTASNGVEVTGVCLYRISKGCMETVYLCYAQNRLFTMLEEEIVTDKGIQETLVYHEVVVEYCILPEYDDMLEAYSDHEVTLAEEQSGM